MTTDTPLTDRKAVDHIGFYSCATVPASFARDLERELNFRREEARVGNIALDNLRGEVDLWFNRFREAARQLDEIKPQA
jgi:hypothetical protein